MTFTRWAGLESGTAKAAATCAQCGGAVPESGAKRMFSSMDRMGPGWPSGAAGTARWTSDELRVVYAVERAGWSRTACEWRQTTA